MGHELAIDVGAALANRLDYWPHPEPPHHLFQFSRRTLAALTEKAGYKTLGADQTSMGLGYSFGTPAAWKRSPKMLAYAACSRVRRWSGRGSGRATGWTWPRATRFEDQNASAASISAVRRLGATERQDRASHSATASQSVSSRSRRMPIQPSPK